LRRREWLHEYNTSGKAPIQKRVAVIGGGNSAVDAARTALRLGAESVSIFYRRMRREMPAQRDEIKAALDEGIAIVELVAPQRIKMKNGKVSGISIVQMKLEDFDRSGRKQPVVIEDQSARKKSIW